MNEPVLKKMRKAELHIGLNDKDTLLREDLIINILNMASDLCREKMICFSSHVDRGGYVNKDGQYILE